MLKLTIHDNVEMLRFQLEGELAGRWVQELEQCWRTAASTLGNRVFQIDLRHVTDMDDAGRNLIQVLRAGGANMLKSEPQLPKKNWFQRLSVCSNTPDAP